jgi:hypothetical protein
MYVNLRTIHRLWIHFLWEAFRDYWNLIVKREFQHYRPISVYAGLAYLETGQPTPETPCHHHIHQPMDSANITVVHWTSHRGSPLCGYEDTIQLIMIATLTSCWRVARRHVLTSIVTTAVGNTFNRKYKPRPPVTELLMYLFSHRTWRVKSCSQGIYHCHLYHLRSKK